MKYRKSRHAVFQTVELLEDRRLLSAAEVDVIISEQFDYQNPQFSIYDFSNNVSDAGIHSGIAGPVIAAIDGFIGGLDVDFLPLTLTAGQLVDLSVTTDPFAWSLIDNPLNSSVRVEAFAANAEPVVDHQIRYATDSNSASTGVNASVSDASASASGSASITPNLLDGSATLSFQMAISIDLESGFGTGASAKVDVSSSASFSSNRSGVLNVTGSTEIFAWHGGFGLNSYTNPAVGISFGNAFNARELPAADGPPFFAANSVDKTADFTWTYLPDESLPVIGLFDASGLLIASSDSQLQFVVPESGSYFLGISQSGQFDGAIDPTYEDEGTGQTFPVRDFYRPYQVSMSIDSPSITLSVTAEFNELGEPSPSSARRGVPRAIQVSSDKFGPFLPGVDLNNKFTITVDGAGLESVNMVKWSIGSASGTATRNGQTNKWTFSKDMRDFSAGMRTLTVQALDVEGNVIQEYQGTVQHRDQLNFELQVDPGATDGLVDVEFTRFFKDIAASLTFTGTVDGLATFYRDKVQVLAGITSLPVSWQSGNGQKQVFTVTSNVGALPLGITNVDFRVGGAPITRWDDTFEPLTTVAQPSWLAGGMKSYDTSTGNYEFHNIRPALLSYSASIAKTDQKLLDTQLKKLDSFARLEALLNIDAPLQRAQPVDFSASQLTARAEILGMTVLNETYTSSTLNFGGTLDPMTLDPTALSVRLKNPLVLADKTFLEKSFSLNLLNKAVPALPDWLLSVNFGLAAKIIGQLTVDGGIMLSKVGTSIQFVSAGTFIKLTAQPQATLTATAKIKVLKGYLAEGEASLTGTATLIVSATANFAGTLTAPTVQSATFSTKLTINYRVTAKVQVLRSAGKIEFDSGSPENGGTSDDVLGPYELVTLSTGKKPKMRF